MQLLFTYEKSSIGTFPGLSKTLQLGGKTRNEHQSFGPHSRCLNMGRGSYITCTISTILHFLWRSRLASCVRRWGQFPLQQMLNLLCGYWGTGNWWKLLYDLYVPFKQNFHFRLSPLMGMLQTKCQKQRWWQASDAGIAMGWQQNNYSGMDWISIFDVICMFFKVCSVLVT